MTLSAEAAETRPINAGRSSADTKWFAVATLAYRPSGTRV